MGKWSINAGTRSSNAYAHQGWLIEVRLSTNIALRLVLVVVPPIWVLASTDSSTSMFAFLISLAPDTAINHIVSLDEWVDVSEMVRSTWATPVLSPALLGEVNFLVVAVGALRGLAGKDQLRGAPVAYNGATPA